MTMMMMMLLFMIQNFCLLAAIIRWKDYTNSTHIKILNSAYLK